jgi:hypothetical protein
MKCLLCSVIALVVCLGSLSGCGSGKEEDYAPEPINKGRPIMPQDSSKPAKDQPERPKVLP